MNAKRSELRTQPVRPNGCPPFCASQHGPFVPGTVLEHDGPAATLELREFEGRIDVCRSVLQDSDGQMLDEVLIIEVEAWGERVRLPIHLDERPQLAAMLGPTPKPTASAWPFLEENHRARRRP